MEERPRGFPFTKIFAPLGSGDPLAEALLRAAGDGGVIRASLEALEILRIEAGIPAFGSELDDTVLPAEAGLLDAVSQTKGCYVGQEVVARMETAGRVSHRLVGLELSGQTLPEAGSPILADAKRVGEVTSCCRSPAAGPIALGFVRSAQADPGGWVDAGGVRARVRRLPFTESAPVA